MLGAHFSLQDANEVAHLSLAGAGIHGGIEVKHHLSLRARHAAECPDGGQLAALLVKIVADEDVAKEVFF